MSGSGRKSQYRKSVTSNFLNENSVPQEGEIIVIVTGNRGSNIFEIQLSCGLIELARLPNKFNKLIWIKKNDYLIVEKNEEPSIPSISNDANSSKVKYVINNIINKINIKNLKSEGLWPAEFARENASEVRDREDLMPGYEETEDTFDDDYNSEV